MQETEKTNPRQSWKGFMPKQQDQMFVPIPSRIQARLNSAQSAKLLGFSEHDIPVLIFVKMLKPLGKPVPNATKYFATCQIEQLAQNPEWLNKATQVIYDYWKDKNLRKRIKDSQPIQKQEEEMSLTG